MVLAGLLAAQKLAGKTLADQTFLFLGAGEVYITANQAFLNVAFFSSFPFL